MRNRILSIILVLLLTVSFTSCGNKEKTAGSSGNYQESSVKDAGGNKDNKIKTDESAEDNTDDMVKTGKIKESDLSDKYRIDLVPIFKGSVIMSTMENPDHKVVGLGCYSKKPYKEVKEYYKGIMSKYEIKTEEENDDTYLDELQSYYSEAQLGDKVYAVVYIKDVSKAPDDYFDAEFKLPKNAKTVFSLQFFNFEE